MEPNGREAPSAPGATGGAELSEREHEILRLVATGASNKQIAQQLVISPNTVKVHLRNIFAKIGVATRTEATLYAMREGLVTITVNTPGNGTGPTPAGEGPAAETAALAVQPVTASPPSIGIGRLPRGAIWLGGLLGVGVIALLGLALFRQPTAPAAAAPTASPRWQVKPQMPTARSGLAAAAYDNVAYAIGGETASGETGANERYDPTSNSWTSLAPMPLPAADISGAAIGGLIYVPGGRQASGAISNALEVYDPRQDHWETKAPMPVALSGYALAAFEGALYVFGGWSGDHYVATVYAYDPLSNQWSTHAPMPTARGFGGAAVAAGKIYVVGGTAGGPPLAVNEAFNPDAEAGGGTAWVSSAPLPAGRAKLAVVGLADIVQVVGGEAITGQQSALEYFPQKNEWETIETPRLQPWSRLGLVAIGTNLYAFGGLAGNAVTAAQWTYQAVYTIAVPIVQ